MLYGWKDCIVGSILCSSSGANRIPLHVCLVMYMYMAIKLSYHIISYQHFYLAKDRKHHIVITVTQQSSKFKLHNNQTWRMHALASINILLTYYLIYIGMTLSWTESDPKTNSRNRVTFYVKSLIHHNKMGRGTLIGNTELSNVD